MRKLNCKHIFHSNCIDIWFIGKNSQTKCPLCNSKPFEANIENLQATAESNLFNQENKDNKENGLNEENEGLPKRAVDPFEYKELKESINDDLKIYENDDQGELK